MHEYRPYSCDRCCCCSSYLLFLSVQDASRASKSSMIDRLSRMNYFLPPRVPLYASLVAGARLSQNTIDTHTHSDRHRCVYTDAYVHTYMYVHCYRMPFNAGKVRYTLKAISFYTSVYAYAQTLQNEAKQRRKIFFAG